MTYNEMGPGSLDYLPCRYGGSKLLFRGPRRKLDAPYVAFLGGTETYGKFIEQPFPALVEDTLDVTCVNLGQPNAGIDAFVHDPFILRAAAAADATVVQVMGAQNMTNRFYGVHPRRNDRFVSASSLLSTIYREVDFSEFHFNKHMLGHLNMISADRFQTIREELQQAWLARMRLMMGQISGKSILLWLSDHAPATDTEPDSFGLGPDPLFITREMIDQIAPYVTEVVEVIGSRPEVCEKVPGMCYSPLEAAAACETLQPDCHAEAADGLSKVLRNLL
jgi:hypothetical protein